MKCESEKLDFVRGYLEALESGDRRRALAFFAPNVVQQEFPNRFSPQGATRNLAALAEAAEQGNKLMASQRYELVNLVGSEDHAAAEVRWTGTLAVPFDKLPAGGQLKAHLAIFLEIRDGKIVRQRNYDCVEPW